jgi:acetyl esterase/lipase
VYGTSDIPETAAPGRIEDATGLPPMYIEVGELYLFREEGIEFATKLWRAGMSTELHIRLGCMHAV